jgi:hypothetical protein
MRASLTPYKIGALIATLISVGIFVGGVHYAHLKQQDERTQNTAFNISDKLSVYADDKQQLPTSLGSAGINNVPSTISYKKISASSYRLCVTYATKYQGVKGKSCQVSQVYVQPFVKNSDGSYTVCGVKTNSYATESTIIPSSVNRPDGAPIIDVGNELFVFSAGSKAFDEQCNPLTRADLKIGDKVDVFDIVYPWQPGTPLKPMVSIFLKRS